jgi:hypothetical protein
VPGIWLTPLVGVTEVATALPRLPQNSLLIGGTADRSWDGEVARKSGLPIHEVPDGDHVLRIADDPIRSVDALRSVVVAMDQFFVSLGDSSVATSTIADV